MKGISASRGSRSAVRIWAGRWKGRRLGVPAGARPTAGRAREALFDIFQDTIAGAFVLDLYAGSGAVGLEAASRGAARVVLVEQAPGPLDRNIETLGASDLQVAVLRTDVATAVSGLRKRGERFDLIFSDPPYGLRCASPSGDELLDLLTDCGVFVIQTDATDRAPEFSPLTLCHRRFYGRNAFYFFTRPFSQR